jgi:hypothetical protein
MLGQIPESDFAHFKEAAIPKNPLNFPFGEISI